MRLRKLGASLAALAVVGAAAGSAIGESGAAGATTAASDGTWGSVQEIPGIAALTATSGGHNPSNVNAFGCSTLGNCVAVGDYGSPATGATELFVATQVDGIWGNAQPLAGLPAVAADTTPTLTNVSCGTPDFCTAVGTYYDTGGIAHVFAVTETRGTWGTPTVLTAPGLGTVQSFGFSGMSCPAAGECTLVGAYTLTGATPAPFTADESAGSWGPLRALAGLASLDQPSSLTVTAGLTSLSCGAPGDCTAGGSYQYGTVQRPFIVSESSHTWGEPQPIPGIAAVSSSGQGDNSRPNLVTSVSCPDASDCAVVGTFFPQLNSPGLFFTLDEAGGAWGQAKALSIPSADSGNAASTAFVSCRSAGNCVIAAAAANDSSAASSEVVAATESSSGAWSAATAIPGISAGDEPYATGLDCVPAGDCTVLGVSFPGGSDPNEIFTATSTDGGGMEAAQQVASSGNDPPLNLSLACPQNGHCTVMYSGLDSTIGVVSTYVGPTMPLMVREATPATVTLTASGLIYGAEQSANLAATVSSSAGGTPTGTVTVTGPGGALCTITLTNGTGSCPLTATELPAGTTTLTAAYGGDAGYLPASGTSRVTVAQAATATSLAFTPRRITFTGAGTRLTVTGSVSSTAGTPSGRVTVRVDSKAAPGCTNVPFTGTVSCNGRTATLAGGKHLVTMTYSGQGDFAASTSASLPLTVAKRGTTTKLALSRTSVTYGRESAEKFTVSVSRAGRVYPTDKVAVRIGGTTICTITLRKGTGSCTLADTRLRAGRYKVVALYSGNGNYQGSGSRKKTLKVAA